MPLRAIFSIIPLLTFVFLSLCIYQRLKEWDHPLRFSLLISATILGVYVVFVTEILNLFHWINFSAIITSWLVALSISLHLILRRSLGVGLRPARTELRADTILIGCCALILVAVGVIALIAPPNHWDVLTYHISRVMHWQQNQSVAHYPTHIRRQIAMGPFAEYAVLHFQILAGSDRFANMIQWSGYAGSAVGASLLAAQFGATRRGQILALSFVATLPIAIVQASAAKNDCVLGFFYLASFSFFLMLKRSPRLFEALLAGSALGLALLTKATAYIFIFPLVIWIILWSIGSFKWFAWKILLPVGCVAVLINTCFWVRNYALFGNPLGKKFETPASAADPAFRRIGRNAVLRYENDEMNPSLFISNVLRNVAIHSVTPFESVNASIHSVVLRIHDLAGANPNDRRTTWYYSKFKRLKKLSYNYETGSPLHLLAAAIATGYCLTRFRASSNRNNLFLPAVVLISAFLVFCFLLRWFHTVARLHVPLFFLSAALTGAVLSLFPRVAAGTRLVTMLLLLCAVPWLIFNETRRLTGPANIFRTGRYEQYFMSRNTRAYESAIEYIVSRQCSDIGFRFSWWNETEYQFWMMLKKQSASAVRVQHVEVENESAILTHTPSFQDFQPCAVLLIDYSRTLPDRLIVNGKEFVTGGSFVDGTARVLLPPSSESHANNIE